MSDLKNSILTKKRELLTQKESSLLEEIENQTSELNEALNKTLKKSIYIGGGLVAGYVVYRLLSNDKKENEKGKPPVKKNTSKNRILKPILSLIAEKGLSILMHSLKK
ncbi:MAG: hypothetical protein ACJA2S_002793 [Cyclobacteriaceae bacterium]|jgi:hypothetical protein